MTEQFLRPQSIAEAVQLKQQYGAQAVYFGGGSKLNATPTRTDKPVAISLQALQLQSVDGDGRQLRVGATVTLQQLRDHELTPAPLKEALGFVYSRHIRNQSTLGGEIAAQQDEHPLLPTLIAMQAQLELAVSPGVTETVTVEDHLAGERDALITALIIPDCHIHCTQQRIVRSAAGLAVLTAAVSLPRDCEHPAKHPVMVIDGMSPLPLRLRDVERLGLEGEALEQAVAELLQPVADLRGSVEYKRYIAGVVMADLLVACQQLADSRHSAGEDK